MDPLTRQVLSCAGAKKSLPYVDDVFSTYVKTGTNASVTINNGIDLSGEGGMVWYKSRSAALNHDMIDTVRGVQKYVCPNTTAGEVTASDKLSAFNNNGFTWGDGVGTNDAVWWTFRKAPGFFDVVTYTGTGSNRTIAHNLGSVPGCIMVKRTDAADSWVVYHRGLFTGHTNAGHRYLYLNTDQQYMENQTRFNNTMPTESVFSVGTDGAVNDNGGTYVAYIFAGGPSTADKARSVDFDGSDDELIPSHTMIPSGQDSNKFCLETWVKLDNTTANQVIYSQYDAGSNGRMMFVYENKKIYLWMGGNEQNLNTGTESIYPHVWYHVAWTYDGTNHRMYLNGNLTDTLAGSSLPAGINQSNERIGKGYGLSSWILQGKLSNFRITWDQVVYTTNFTPSTTPFTTTSQGVTGTNCKMLCCNSATLTNNEGTLGTLTTGGDPTGSTDNPFDDPAGWVFGENEDKNIIKCGAYGGNGSDNGPKIVLGFVPQFVIIKNVSSSNEHWTMFDTIRKLSTGYTGTVGPDARLTPSSSSDESDGTDYIDLIPGGFRMSNSANVTNKSGDTFVYIAVRKTDGDVGKPAEAGTEVFNMIAGTSSADIPTFVSGFPVDYNLLKNPGGSGDWYSQSRLTGTGYLIPNSTAAEASSTPNTWDFMNGWYSNTGNFSNYQSWMWKQGQGMDVVNYTGNGVAGRTVAHSLGRTPEMIWIKARYQSSARDWHVGHIGINGGTSPWNGFLKLNSTAAASGADNQAWNSTAPTSTVFTLGDAYSISHDGYQHIAMLFASVDGISKCGYWAGDGTSNDSKVITTGFTPRFVIIKRANGTGNWLVIDTLRGFTKYLRLSLGNAEDTQTFITATSTGFTISNSDSDVNAAGSDYIYYAHA